MAADKLLAEWFWTDRWMGSSAFLLPMEARGLYREMLTQAWRRGARLPSDPVMVQRAVGCTAEEWARCWPLVSRFWRVDGNALVNDTQLEIYADARANVERNVERAKAAADARWRAPRNAQASPQAQPEQCPPSPSPSPSPSPISVSEKATRLAVRGDGPWPSVQALVTLYNDLTPDECPAVQTLSEARREKIRKYVRQFPDEEFWRKAFIEIKHSAFLRGLRNSNGHGRFVADLDWLLQRGKDGTENVVKVRDGKYADGR